MEAMYESNSMESLTNRLFLLLPLNGLWRETNTASPVLEYSMRSLKSTWWQVNFLGPFLLRLPFPPEEIKCMWWCAPPPNLYALFYYLENIIWFFSYERVHSQYTVFNFVTSMWLSILSCLIFYLFSEE